MIPNPYYIPDSVGASHLVKEFEAAIEKNKLQPLKDRLEKFMQSNAGDDRRITFIVSGSNGYYLKPIEENPTGWIVIAQDKGQNQ